MQYAASLVGITLTVFFNKDRSEEDLDMYASTGYQLFASENKNHHNSPQDMIILDQALVQK